MNYDSLYYFLNTALAILENWWWVILPFILWRPFLFLYLWWRVDNFLSQQRPVVLEIKLPKEISKPIRAMEVVFSGIHAAICQPPDRWEKWIDGQVQLSLAIEIVSSDGETHFFIRTPMQYRDSVEASLYAQYSEIEIVEVEDYTKKVPQNIPNKEWDLFGCTYRFAKEDYYPIKTYTEFETEREVTEEEMVDPVAALLEGMSKIKKGEQLWIQFLISPLSDADIEKSLSKWKKEGEKLRDKLARREAPVSGPTKSIIHGAIDVLLTGEAGLEPPKKEEKELIPPEMKLTPGEREVLAAIEHKMSKPIFETTVRFIFMGKIDVWFKSNFRLVFSYFNQYTTNNLNALFPLGKTLTKIKKSFFLPLNLSFIRDRKKYLKSRRLFRKYIRRDSPFFPLPGGTVMLNVEELASLIHFPSERTAPAPGFSRIEVKRRGTPSSLPSESE